MNSFQKVAYLLENNEHMVVSTADKFGKPCWVSPVFYVYDDDYNLYWVSAKDTLHSKNIRENKRVAIVIFGPLSTGESDGVYFDALVKELKIEAEINDAIKILHRRTQPKKYMVSSSNEVKDDAAWRIYKARPKQIFKRLTITDTASGQVVNKREKISLKKEK
jgi:uncharacterized protein YhbP (UPF0306 family)